jgi:hypothetical protein
MRKLKSLVLLVVVCATSLVVSMAQTATFVITEDTINESYRVTAPVRTSVSDVSVDLQSGQVVISATFTPRRTGVANATVSTLQPTIVDGEVVWQVISVTSNGQPASQEVINQVNTAIVNSWRVYFREQSEADLLTLFIDDDSITYTFDSNGRVTTVTEVQNGSNITTITEADVNAAIADTTHLKNISVDFQPNAVTIRGDWTGSRGNSIAVSATYAPSVASCDVSWTLLSATASITGLGTATTTSFTNSLKAVWTSYWATQDARVCVDAVTITDTNLSYTLSR